MEGWRELLQEYIWCPETPREELLRLAEIREDNLLTEEFTADLDNDDHITRSIN